MASSFTTPLQFDSITRGAHLYNVTARIQDDRLRFTGSFDAAELLPVLIFSVGVPWIKPCVDNLCCLWDVAMRYKDDDLIAAIGKTCDKLMNFTEKDLMKGSTVTSPAKSGNTIEKWDLTTRVHPNFVVMLFMCLTPVFYMYYEIVPIQWIEKTSVTWSASWYGEPCHTVLYPDGKEVCIHCSNSKPEHSKYIFTADWFQTFECRWQCDAGYAGSNCEVSIDTAIYASGGVFIVLCVAGMVLAATNKRSFITHKSIKAVPVLAQANEDISHHDMEAEKNTPLLPTTQTPRVQARSEMIAFKDNAIGEIRIKFL